MDLKLRIGNVQIEPSELAVEEKRDSYKWDSKTQKYQYLGNKNNHRFVLHEDDPKTISFHLANNSEDSESVVQKFSLDPDKIRAGGRIYPEKPMKLSDLVLEGTCYHYGSFIPLSVARNYTRLLIDVLAQEGIVNPQVKLKHNVQGKIDNFWIENGFLPSTIRQKRYSVERATEIIDNILDETEDIFRSEYGTHPSLHSEEDYVRLGKILNIASVSDKFKHIDDREKDNSSKSYITYSLAGSDIAYRLMRRFLERQGLFDSLGENKEIAFDGIMGRLEYNPPRREFEFRIKSLQKLLNDGVEIPDDWDSFINDVGMIAGNYPVTGLCFLPKSYQKIWDKPEGKKTKIGYKNIGTHLVNPSAHSLTVWEDIKNFKELIEKYKRSGHPKFGFYS